jgi:adenine/guanine phosphoribosyltransferase-like PRPP-binding protein
MKLSETPRDCYQGAGHTTNFLYPQDLSKFLKRALSVLKSKKFKEKYPEYDTIAFSGYSGALIAPYLALSLGKDLVLVRKDSDKCVSSYKVEGNRAIKKYIIVDDLVSSGRTANRIYEKIKEQVPDAECLGVLQVQQLESKGSDTNLYLDPDWNWN